MEGGNETEIPTADFRLTPTIHGREQSTDPMPRRTRVPGPHLPPRNISSSFPPPHSPTTRRDSNDRPARYEACTYAVWGVGMQDAGLHRKQHVVDTSSVQRTNRYTTIRLFFPVQTIVFWKILSVTTTKRTDVPTANRVCNDRNGLATPSSTGNVNDFRCPQFGMRCNQTYDLCRSRKSQTPQCTRIRHMCTKIIFNERSDFNNQPIGDAG